MITKVRQRRLKYEQPWLVSHHFTHREPAFAAMRDYPPFQLFLKPRE